MNIKEAKTQIENAVVAYFSKDRFGNYMIPIERQRPIFMIGPPGIGKTAIMEQIARTECRPRLLLHDTSHPAKCAWSSLHYLRRV